MNSEMTSAIIFDLDGTLYESKEIDHENRRAAILAISAHLNVDADAAEKLLALSQKTSQGTLSISKTLENMGINDKLIADLQNQLVRPEDHIAADPQLVELMRKLKRNYKIGLLTNTRRQIALRIINLLGFQDSDFDIIVAGGDGHSAKPSVGTLKFSLDILNADPARSYTVGDRWLVDHAPGERLGVKSIMVENRLQLITWLKRCSESGAS